MPEADLSGIKQRRVGTNGIELNIAEQGEGPLVLMLHGFPESWYSWRHQIPAVAGAGFHAVAPDMRGYGKSDKPDDIATYNQVEVTNDIIGLISALGYETAIVFGHDWGAPTAWSCALHHPDKVTAVGVLSVPFSPRSSVPPLDMMKEIFKDMFFYQLYFQEPGIAEAEWETNTRVNLRKFYHIGSGAFDASNFIAPKSPDSDLLSDIEDPGTLGDWCTESDLDFYTTEFEQSGFRGPLNYYRNHNLTWSLTEGGPEKINQPALFIAGEKDGVIMLAADALKNMPSYVTNLKVNQLIPGVGHWTQQEAPEAVNSQMIDFLNSVKQPI
ncbi:alpha/beta hydrolase [Gammaproteobacteria bacterium]|nr:alpha/beta hydrolase [Gammaproteobacteria bacterium]